ncbi:hypothetical protein [Flavobacterium phycosphaerae]|uniref:hypothetical protein n=1 Tax=Flavobacterium phycosphaerae TaxID=2697515 RepID=UPI00138A1584|nr:hypothetical protein [Flavobacterium phycosphaerae]
MRTKFFAAVILFSVLLTSCKDDKSANATAQDPVKEQGFKVVVNATVKKDDSFSIFYTEDGTADFTKIQPIWVDVKGSNTPQDVVFNLPADVYPSQLRLDFGVNKTQEDIVFNSATFSYFDKSEKISGPDLGIFFRQDDSKCTYDYKTGVIKALVKDNVRTFPSLYPHEENMSNLLKRLSTSK